MNLDTVQLKETINEFYENLLKISENNAAQKGSPDKWSNKEILGHLIDSSNINLNRFMKSLIIGDLVFDKYPQDEYVVIQRYNEIEWTDLVELWKLNNLHIINLVGNIPSSKLSKLTYAHNFDQICFNKVSENEKSNLEYLISDYFEHLKYHLNQIFHYNKD